MKISFQPKVPASGALIVLADGPDGVFAGADVVKAVKPALKAEKFEGKKGRIVAVPGAGGSYIFVAGTGKVADLKTADFEALGAGIVSALNARKISSASVQFSLKGLKGITEGAAAAAVGLGARLAAYRFDRYLTKEPKDKKPTLISLTISTAAAAAAKKDFAGHEALAKGVFLTRDLVSLPPNVLYPESFAGIIKKELAPLGVKVTVLGRREIRKLGMGALAAVGQGSAREEQLVSMEYNGAGKSAKKLAFVGKGVTFDTGGISIKPAAGMDEMKWDMAGAGAVTGLLKALASRKAKVNVVGVVALAENMPGGDACRPGDIVSSMSGQTVEILNTDAEGRLILCDALTWCQKKFAPTHIVDLATLTGAVIVALGHEYAGLFSNDDALADDLKAAGSAVGEPLWRMPLHDEWDKALDSPAADIKNIAGSTTGAGSAIGAHFLKRFIGKDVKWAHLDIAGVAWGYRDRPGVPKGATAFGVRLLERFVADVLEKRKA